jgi:catechol 2,3-dioxygenase-like lactoylglutathione lyase family enzyme
MFALGGAGSVDEPLIWRVVKRRIWMKWVAISAGLLIEIAGIGGFAQTGAMKTDAGEHPVLINTCLISKDVKTLAAFYGRILKIEPQFAVDNYVEFRTAAGVLAIFDAGAQENYIPGAAVAGANRSVVLEFRVDNVDAEYARLQSVVKTWVKGPTTQPWGTRSIYFRDPDGNLVDFFTVPRARGN